MIDLRGWDVETIGLSLRYVTLDRDKQNSIRLGNGDDILYLNDGGLTVVTNKGSDTIYGRAGDDTIFMSTGDAVFGGAGNDQLFGGDGADMFYFSFNYDRDTVYDFEDGVDLIDLRGFTLSQIGDALNSARQVGQSVNLDFGNGDILQIRNIDLADVTMDDFIV